MANEILEEMDLQMYTGSDKKKSGRGRTGRKAAAKKGGKKSVKKNIRKKALRRPLRMPLRNAAPSNKTF